MPSDIKSKHLALWNCPVPLGGVPGIVHSREKHILCGLAAFPQAPPLSSPQDSLFDVALSCSVCPSTASIWCAPKGAGICADDCWYSLGLCLCACTLWSADFFLIVDFIYRSYGLFFPLFFDLIEWFFQGLARALLKVCHFITLRTAAKNFCSSPFLLLVLLVPSE